MELAQDQKQKSKSNKKPGSGAKKINFSKSDNVSLYLELADCYRMSGQNQKASRVMQEAMAEYKGTSEEIRITVANADLAAEKKTLIQL